MGKKHNRFMSQINSQAELNEDLVKFRYIQLLETIEIESVQDMFLRYDISDQEVLDSLKIHFKSFL